MASAMSTPDGLGLGTLGLDPGTLAEMTAAAGFAGFVQHAVDDPTKPLLRDTPLISGTPAIRRWDNAPSGAVASGTGVNPEGGTDTGTRGSGRQSGRSFFRRADEVGSMPGMSTSSSW
jgi:hypothetical protein